MINPEVLAAAAEKLLSQQVSRRPVHVHQCPDGHRWICPSPYCEDVSSVPRRCPGHGGELPRDTRPEDFDAGA